MQLTDESTVVLVNSQQAEPPESKKQIEKLVEQPGAPSHCLVTLGTYPTICNGLVTDGFEWKPSDYTI